MLPTFLICGAQKAGTTALHKCLRRHPEIHMPPAKELNFFNRNYVNGQNWYMEGLACHKSVVAVGEASPLYMCDKDVPERIAETLPEVKLIFILRNPIERAYSHYCFNIAQGAPIQLRFSDVIRTSKGFELYVARGFYYEQIKRFLSYFSRDRLLILLTDRLRSEPLACLINCCRFLDVDEKLVEDSIGQVNVTYVPGSPLRRRAYQSWAALRRRVNSWGVLPAQVKRMTQPLREEVYRRVFRARRPSPMCEEDRRFLEEVYVPHNRALERFLGAETGELWTS